MPSAAPHRGHSQSPASAASADYVPLAIEARKIKVMQKRGPENKAVFRTSRHRASSPPLVPRWRWAAALPAATPRPSRTARLRSQAGSRRGTARAISERSFAPRADLRSGCFRRHSCADPGVRVALAQPTASRHYSAVCRRRDRRVANPAHLRPATAASAACQTGPHGLAQAGRDPASSRARKGFRSLPAS